MDDRSHAAADTRPHWAELHRQVVFGESGGRIIWQPRIGCWYSDKVYAGEPLPPAYAGMTIPEIHRALGCSARLTSSMPATAAWNRT